MTQFTYFIQKYWHRIFFLTWYIFIFFFSFYIKLEMVFIVKWNIKDLDSICVRGHIIFKWCERLCFQAITLPCQLYCWPFVLVLKSGTNDRKLLLLDWIPSLAYSIFPDSQIQIINQSQILLKKSSESFQKVYLNNFHN